MRPNRLSLALGAACMAIAGCTVSTPEESNEGAADTAAQEAPIASVEERQGPAEEENMIRPVDNGAVDASAEGDGAMRWQKDDLGLSYGGSENRRLAIRCTSPGEAILSFVPDATQIDPAPRIAVVAGKARRNVPAETETDAQGSVKVEARIPIDAAPMEAFGRGSPLELRWGDELRRVPGPGPGGEVRGFLSSCAP